jgi:hypothetical protein
MTDQPHSEHDPIEIDDLDEEYDEMHRRLDEMAGITTHNNDDIEDDFDTIEEEDLDLDEEDGFSDIGSDISDNESVLSFGGLMDEMDIEPVTDLTKSEPEDLHIDTGFDQEAFSKKATRAQKKGVSRTLIKKSKQQRRERGRVNLGDPKTASEMKKDHQNEIDL